MLTLMTQTAIAILSDISEKGRSQHYKQYCLFPNVLSELLNKFEYAGLIRLIEGKERGQISSYELCKSINELSLLNILEATGEHLNCNHETTEELYSHCSRAAHRLGIINQITRLYLSEIKLADL